MLDIRCTYSLADVDKDVDVAIRFGPGGWRGLQSQFLGEESLFPVVCPTYRNGDWPTCQSDLVGHVLIHHPESSWRLWLDPAETDPTHSGNALYIDDSELALDAAAAGHGIALARGRIVDSDLKSGRLIRILDRAATAEYNYWAVWSASSSKLSLIEPFVAAVARLFAIDYRSTNE